MPFDLNQLGGLFSDPTFAMGASLYANARQPGAVGNAFGLMQQMQQQKMQAAQQAQLAADTKEFKTAQMAHMLAQEKAAADAEARKQQHEDEAQRIQAEKDARDEAWMKQVTDRMFPGAAAAPKPAATPSGAVGKFGTPAHILDGFERTESGGNPLAVGPAIPGSKERALGAYQFLPSTTNMLKQQGHTFNPFDKAQSRDAADYYFQQLLQQNGGDQNKAIAAYGGFKTKDPSKYIQKVTGGAPASSAAAATPTPPSGMELAQLGALGAVAGRKGGAQLVELGKMMQPQNVPAGGYQRAADGSMTFTPDPYREASAKNDAARVGLESARVANDTARTNDEQAKTALALEEKRTKAAHERANTEAAVNGVVNGMKRMSDNVDALLAHPGLGSNTGALGALGVPKIPGTAAHDASVLLDSLKSKLVVNTMMDLKAASKTGSTGFGQLSEKEGMRLETYIQNLDRAQTLPAMKKALTDIKKFSNESAKQYQSKFESTYGNAGPAVGTVKGGYRFKGGDPADKANWEKQ